MKGHIFAFKKAIAFFLGICTVIVLLLTIPSLRDGMHWSWAHYAKNTIRSYQNYISSQPQGRFVETAKDKIANLSSAEEPFAAALDGTEASLSRFLNEFPGHNNQAEAKQILADMLSGRDIVSLLDEGKIEIEAQGGGIQHVNVKLRKQVPYPLTVNIPAGTYFVPGRKSTQNMIVTKSSTVRLTSDAWNNIFVSVACANRPLAIPGSGDNFTVQRSPQQAQLARLMSLLDKSGVSYAVQQAAVWIITDDANYRDLGSLTVKRYWYERGVRLIKEQEAGQAIKMAIESGIDVKEKAIWEDIDRILSGMEDGLLRAWLIEYKKTERCIPCQAPTFLWNMPACDMGCT